MDKLRGFLGILIASVIGAATVMAIQDRPTRPISSPPSPLSFPTPSPQGKGQVFREDERVTMQLRFVRAEIAAILEFFSKATGKIFVPHPDLEGTLTLIAPFRLTVEEALQVLAAALQVRGFTLIPEGDRIVKIVPITEARQQAIATRFGDLTKPPVPPSQLITQVFQLRYLNARQIQQELQPLLSAQNALIASTSIGNLLIIVDTEANIRRFKKLLELMDVDLSKKVTIVVLPLRYANAEQVAQTLGQLLAPFGVVVGTAPTPTAPGRPARQRGRRSGTTSLSVTTASIQIVPFPHNNSLLLWAPKERLPWLRDLVAKLDTPAVEALRVEVFKLQYADAVDLERILSELFEQTRQTGRQRTAPIRFTTDRRAAALPSPRRRAIPTEPQAIIAADARTNSLVVAADRERMEVIRNLIKELDIDARPNLQFEIIPLQRAYAPDLAQVLQTLLSGDGATPQRQPAAARFAAFFRRLTSRPTAPQPTQPVTGGIVRSGELRIAADTRSNALIVAATKDNLHFIKQLVMELDKDYAPPIKVKVFELQYADATQVADILNRLVQTSDQRRRPGFFPVFFLGDQREPSPNRWLGFQQNVVAADPRRNAIIVSTTEANMDYFEKLIAELDKPADLGRMVKVYSVQFMDAQDLAETINEILQRQRRPTGFLFFLFAGDTQRLGPLQNLQDVTVTADTRTNQIVVIAPPSAFTAVESLIRQLDQPQPQVFIEVIIADVTLTKELQFGVEWNIMQEKAVIFGERFQTEAELKTAPTPPPQQGIFYSVLSETFRATLQALARDQKVRILATPHILTMANVQATIRIGQLFPVVTSFFPGTVGTPPQIDVEMQEIATTLQVTPHVNQAGYITMDISQTIDELGGTVQQAGFTQPIITTRVARTSVMVKSGQTVVIGGIMRHRTQTVETGIPFLKDIPLIGALFRRTEKIKERTELMVFLTPYIIRQPEDLQLLMRRQEKWQKYLREGRSSGGEG